MEVVEFGPLTPQDRTELEGTERDPFDSAGIALQYRSKDRHIGLRDDSGRLVASTGILLVEVDVAGDGFPVVGLGGVIVSAPHRGHGLGRGVVQAALSSAQLLGPAFAILFCHQDRAGLYRKLGFAEIRDEVLVQQPNGYAAMPQETMWRGLRKEVAWPSGKLVVHSLPF